MGDEMSLIRRLEASHFLPRSGRSAAAALALALTCAALPAAAGVLETVKARGTLICGINPNLPGFGAPDAQGAFQGLNADICRAVAAAVLGDAGKVKFLPLTAANRFTALQTGEVDVLTHNTTWTMSRDTALGMRLVATAYYDGQGFLVRRALGVKSATELAGASVCAQQGSTTELNAADFFRARNLKYEAVTFASNDEATAAFGAGRCEVLTGDASALIGERRKLASPGDFTVLPDIISKEPLGPAVRKGDDTWFDIVRWTFFALVNAEEAGVTKANADEMAKGKNPEVRRLLGAEGEFGKGISLEPAWALNAVKAVGNYGEIFDRNLGEGSAIKLPRGANALWSKGGLMYAPPVR